MISLSNKSSISIPLESRQRMIQVLERRIKSDRIKHGKRKTRTNVKLVERLLCCLAKDEEDYSDHSALPEKLKEVATRILLRRLRRRHQEVLQEETCMYDSPCSSTSDTKTQEQDGNGTVKQSPLEQLPVLGNESQGINNSEEQKLPTTKSAASVECFVTTASATA